MRSGYRRFSFPVILLLLTVIASAQSSSPLLKLQHGKADLSLETGVVHARGMEGLTYGKFSEVASYPNSLSCLIVYGDGKFILEKRDEQTVGKPKVKRAEGTLNTDDLQHLKSILDEEALKKIATPPVPAPPDNGEIREVENTDAFIDHGGSVQIFTLSRRRFKMRASMTGGFTNGMDTYVDNGAPFRKTMTPLMKWFEDLQKKSKSDLKDAQPQYCTPINIG